MGKLALLVGVSKTREEDLPELPSALRDIQAMQEVLQNSDLGGFDSVEVLSDPTRQKMEEAIETLFANRKKDDLVLFYFSGHGITDERGKLYLVTPETRKDRGKLRKSTAVAATVLHEHMNSSGSKRQVLILDSCFSGAIADGLTVKSDSRVDIERELGGEGRAILTSSNAVQKSFHIQGYALSIYTHYLIDGIQTGAANQDEDDYISADELHEYVRKKLEQEAPLMSPQFFPIREGHKIRLVRSPKPQGNPELEYRQEAEARFYQGEFSPTARRLLNRKRDRLGLSIEQAEAIEVAVKKPWQERQRKLQEYEENLLEELKQHKPLRDRTLVELNDYRQELGLRPEDIEPIHRKLNVSMALSEPSPAPPATEPLPVNEPTPTDDLASERGIDYTKLRDLLVAGNWKAADEETLHVMLQVVQQEEEGYLDLEDFQNFPCMDLCTIDRLWVHHSQGKFGFSVQKQIWEECGSPTYDYDANFDDTNKDWNKFGDCVGWRKDGDWLRYDDISFNLKKSPQGELPGCVWGWWWLGESCWLVESLLGQKLVDCDCNTSILSSKSLPVIQPLPVVQTALPDDLASEKGIDYTKLRDLLAAGNWKAADMETYRVMITTVGKERGQLLNEEDLLNFPCEDLRTIDSLWVKYSNGHFGFSVQKKIYVECGAKLDGEYPGDEIWRKFGDRLGWRKDGEWLSYRKLNPSLSFSRGSFPVWWCVVVGHSLEANLVASLAQRLVDCNV